MKISALYSHLNGHEWMLIHCPDIWQEIVDIIGSIDAASCRTKISQEKTMKGQVLYSPKMLNQEFEARFDAKGWQESRTSYWVTDDMDLIRGMITLPAEQQKLVIQDAGKTPILSYNQTDFQKGRVSVEIQFGKYAFIAYDLFVKHLAFYLGGEIQVGVEILPMKAMQSQMSSGPGYYEGALYDIGRQGRGSPPVPLVLIGIEEDSSSSSA